MKQKKACNKYRAGDLIAISNKHLNTVMKFYIENMKGLMLHKACLL